MRLPPNSHVSPNALFLRIRLLPVRNGRPCSACRQRRRRWRPDSGRGLPSVRPGAGESVRPGLTPRAHVPCHGPVRGPPSAPHTAVGSAGGLREARQIRVMIPSHFGNELRCLQTRRVSFIPIWVQIGMACGHRGGGVHVASVSTPRAKQGPSCSRCPRNTSVIGRNWSWLV